MGAAPKTQFSDVGNEKIWMKTFPYFWKDTPPLPCMIQGDRGYKVTDAAINEIWD